MSLGYEDNEDANQTVPRIQVIMNKASVDKDSDDATESPDKQHNGFGNLAYDIDDDDEASIDESADINNLNKDSVDVDG